MNNYMSLRKPFCNLPLTGQSNFGIIILRYMTAVQCPVKKLVRAVTAKDSEIFTQRRDDAKNLRNLFVPLRLCAINPSLRSLRSLREIKKASPRIKSGATLG